MPACPVTTNAPTPDEKPCWALAGTRLEEGAQYIDLNHLERGAFPAEANMIALPEHLYVAKKETDYVLWNRLNQEENPARLDEPDSSTSS